MTEDDKLIDRLEDASGGAGGDKLKEILSPQVGGEAGRLRNKLAKLWEGAEDASGKSGLEEMKARNTAIRLAKGEKPRRKDNP